MPGGARGASSPSVTRIADTAMGMLTSCSAWRKRSAAGRPVCASRRPSRLRMIRSVAVRSPEAMVISFPLTGVDGRHVVLRSWNGGRRTIGQSRVPGDQVDAIVVAAEHCVACLQTQVEGIVAIGPVAGKRQGGAGQ